MGISKHDKGALAELFIDMGVPLVTAIQTVESWSVGSDEPPSVAKQAETLAKLLNTTVDFATKITRKMVIRDAYTLEQVRGRIIKIVTPIIGDYYMRSGELPQAESLDDVAALFDVLVSFSESVSPKDDTNDKHHAMAHVIEGASTILTAVQKNDFGFERDELFQAIMDGLKDRAAILGETLAVEDVYCDGLFASIATVYASCYEAVLNRMSAGSDLEGQKALNAVWGACDERLMLIQGLTGFVGENVGIKPAKGKPQAAPKPQVKAASKDNKPKTAKAPAKSEEKPAAKPSSNENENENEDDADEDDDFNPMAFFAGGKG